MNAIFDKKAHFFASENFPFGSEMVYDSTAFEAVYGYGKRIHSEHVSSSSEGIICEQRKAASLVSV